MTSTRLTFAGIVSKNRWSLDRSSKTDPGEQPFSKPTARLGASCYSAVRADGGFLGQAAGIGPGQLRDLHAQANEGDLDLPSGIEVTDVLEVAEQTEVLGGGRAGRPQRALTGQRLTVAGMKWLPHTGHSSILISYAESVAPDIARNAEAFDGGRPIARGDFGVGRRTAGSVSERGLRCV